MPISEPCLRCITQLECAYSHTLLYTTDSFLCGTGKEMAFDLTGLHMKELFIGIFRYVLTVLILTFLFSFSCKRISSRAIPPMVSFSFDLETFYDLQTVWNMRGWSGSAKHSAKGHHNPFIAVLTHSLFCSWCDTGLSFSLWEKARLLPNNYWYFHVLTCAGGVYSVSQLMLLRLNVFFIHI